ncbi:hypothetical protein KEM48_004687 [Puccinia striiformis f. sp. tritici PST-130]|nr:hypothetical protein KEM48_004687 [Puccinia striiformis f. sp. tritici PST-130]
MGSTDYLADPRDTPDIKNILSRPAGTIPTISIVWYRKTIQRRDRYRSRLCCTVGHSNEDDDWEESQSQHPANSSHDFTSINDFIPPLSDADPDVVTSTALVCYNPNQASTWLQDRPRLLSLTLRYL